MNFKLHLKVPFFPYYPLGRGTAAGQTSAVRTRLCFFLFLPSISLLLLHLANNRGFLISPWSIEGVREGEGGQESSYLPSIYLRIWAWQACNLACSPREHFVDSVEKIHPLSHTGDPLMWVNAFLLQLAASDSFPAPRHLPAPSVSFCWDLSSLYLVIWHNLDHLPLGWSRSGLEKILLCPLLDNLWERGCPQCSNLPLLCC